MTTPVAKSAVNFFFRDPPSFVFSDLNVERSITMTRLKREPIPFIGRDCELAELETLLLETEEFGSFAWRTVQGVSGIGKTRLALEWLALAQSKKWDVGIVDPDDAELLLGWRSRRSTALVIDEARTVWSADLDKALCRLKDGANGKYKVRVLVLSQISPYAEGAAPAEIRDFEVSTPFILGPLREHLIDFIKHMDVSEEKNIQKIIEQSAGRPRAAIIMANAPDGFSYNQALNDWAYRILPELRSPDSELPVSVTIGLIVAGLVGSIDAQDLFAVDPDFDPRLLERFFGQQYTDHLSYTLPAFLPPELGVTIALHLLDRIAPARRTKLVKYMLVKHQRDIESSLAAIWLNFVVVDDPDSSTSVHVVTLTELLDDYDRQWPERSNQLQMAIQSIKRKITSNALQLNELEHLLTKIANLASIRPFDRNIQYLAARAICSASECLGEAGVLGKDEAFQSFERWGSYLAEMIETPTFNRDREILIEQAKMAVAATLYYGQAGAAGKFELFEVLERWAGRLSALSAIEDLQEDNELRYLIAKAATNATLYYGQSFDLGYKNAAISIEHWASWLTVHVATPSHETDRETSLMEAKAFLNINHFYGKAVVLGDDNAGAAMDRWADRISRLANLQSFAKDGDFRLLQMKAAANRTYFRDHDGAVFGSDTHKAFEIWWERISKIVAMPEFESDDEIRLWEAKTIVNAMNGFGEASRVGDKHAFAEFERWGARLTSLAENPEFSNNRAIRLEEIKMPVNAIKYYGSAAFLGSLDAKKALDEWTDRLATLILIPHYLDDCEFRIWEVKAMVNILNAYGKLKRFSAFDQWEHRLRNIMENPSFAADRQIQLEVAKVAVNATFYLGKALAEGDKQAEADLEHWGARLSTVVANPSFATDREIRLEETKAIVNAISAYGQAGVAGNKNGFAQLEAWGARFSSVMVEPALALDHQIRVEESKAAVNAIYYYGKAGKSGFGVERSWRRRLAHLAQQFHFVSGVSEQANKYQVSRLDQEKRNWPYGKFDDAK